MGGDGGWMVIDPNDPGHIYASAYNCDIARPRNGKWIDASRADLEGGEGKRLDGLHHDRSERLGSRVHRDEAGVPLER